MPFALSLTDSSNFQSLAGPPHFTSLFPWQSARGFLVSFSDLQRGGQKGCQSSVVAVQEEEEEEAVEEEKEKQSGWNDGRREGWKQFEEVVRSG
ncbi:hypothetical protein PAMP_024629 [Pampus punctatissimus]